jgi:hypothetical protein
MKHPEAQKVAVPAKTRSFTGDSNGKKKLEQFLLRLASPFPFRSPSKAEVICWAKS